MPMSMFFRLMPVDLAMYSVEGQFLEKIFNKTRFFGPS